MKVQSLGVIAAASLVDQAVADREIIQYCGRQFSCSPEMAHIFLKHAREVIENGDEQLVPLLHSGGIEMLFVSRTTPYRLLRAAEM